MRRFADGDLSARAEGADECGELFNRIAGQFRARLTELNDALAERQSALLVHQRRLAGAERLAALGALVARLAHEVGTPLHSIAGHLDQMLADEQLPGAARDRVEIIGGEVDRLISLIRGHLRRLRAPDPELEETNLAALIARILGVMDPVLDVRSIEVRYDEAPGASEPFLCDPRQVEQVVLNLVQNALDAMPTGGTLVIRVSQTESGHAISVADSGSGVPAEIQDRVFEPFFSTKEAGQGTGLGLALCREIARGHGGDILLDSEPGIGTVVTLTLGSSE
ncbi:MAG: sensor histidine kinase [Planctomycetota bacterium]|jgi:signal transduction histidine kinase